MAASRLSMYNLRQVSWKETPWSVDSPNQPGKRRSGEGLDRIIDKVKRPVGTSERVSLAIEMDNLGQGRLTHPINPANVAPWKEEILLLARLRRG